MLQTQVHVCRKSKEVVTYGLTGGTALGQPNTPVEVSHCPIHHTDQHPATIITVRLYAGKINFSLPNWLTETKKRAVRSARRHGLPIPPSYTIR